MSAAVPFQKIPSNIRVPLFYAEVNNSRANTAQQQQRSLVIGQKLQSGSSAGAATPNKPVRCGGAAQAAQQAGPGSMLHLMAKALFLNDPFGETWLLPLADASGATAALGSLKFLTAATQAGTLTLYIGGGTDSNGAAAPIQMPVQPTQTTAQLASALVALVNGTPNLPVSAAVNGSVSTQVDFTALNAGPGGNDIDLRLNYYGAINGEAVPAGLTGTFTTTATAATGNVGNGTISVPTIAFGNLRGVYSVVFTGATAFTVTDPDGNTVGTGTVGTAFTTGGLIFTVTAGGTAFSAGDSFSIDMPPMTGGTIAPSLSTGLANLGDMAFDFIAMPYTDATSLNAMQAFLNDTTGRWSWEVRIFGHMVTFKRGTWGTLSAFGPTRNDQHASIPGLYDSPSPSWVWAAATIGAVAPSLRNFAPQPLQTLTVLGVLAPPLESRFMLNERNNLLYDGISTYNILDDGTVQIERLITTYQVNAYDQPDDSYLPIERMFQLMFVLRFLQARVLAKFGRMALVDDGTRFAAGLPITTPSGIRGDQIAAYHELEVAGQVQDADEFADGLVVARNASSRNRVDVLWDGDVTDQLNILALLAMFSA